MSLVASITALTSFSLAWFQNNLNINNTLSLVSGESVASIEGYLYKQNPANVQTQDLLGFYKNQLPGGSLNVTRAEDTTDVGSFNITFSDSIFADFNLLSTYLSEHTLNELAFPSYYLELRIIKENFDAYTKMTIIYQGIPSASSSEIDFSNQYPFNYRILKVDNNPNDLYESALPAFVDHVRALPSNRLFADSSSRTNGIPVFTLADLAGAPVNPATPGLAPQLYLLGFPFTSATTGNILFTKSIVFEFRLDPLMFLQLLRSHPDAKNKSIRFGITFKVDVEYSNEPIMEN